MPDEPTSPDRTAQTREAAREPNADNAPADIRAMAHELRTPISAVIAFAEMIELEQFGALGDPRYRDYARDIADSARLALDIVAASLENRDESDLLTRSCSEVDVAETLLTCLRMVRRTAEEAGITLIEAFAVPLPKLRTDTAALKQIVLNLLGNAMKFTPEGGHITVSAGEAEGGLFEIAVTDTGLGMTRSEVDLLATAATTDGSTAGARSAGHGIGFTRIRRLAGGLGAEFVITSSRGSGTTASLIFREAPPVFREAPPVAPPKRAGR